MTIISTIRRHIDLTLKQALVKLKNISGPFQEPSEVAWYDGRIYALQEIDRFLTTLESFDNG